ncbi:hypothetical protein PsAD2_04653 [Pseudovibrio axinellae]|uniref:Uncharacterized protein n=1 Tax=Pseudovibrio axinellae TaxID=989403 RepID=A0A165SWI0_9HYPH|nr:hypothetical protein PsAD2_04653 [Pseudovibrio axinellae]SEQ72705.1 hypothetical protein SAMN05421798_10455 [Pseudovibrio axinellae]
MYRIRAGNIQVCNDYFCRTERRYLAERRTSFFRLFSFWSPVTDALWRRDEGEARRDAQHDADLRKPIATPEIFEVE